MAGIVAAPVLNTRRTESSQHVFTEMDFVPRNEEEAQFEEIVAILQEQLAWLHAEKATPEQIAAARATWKKNLSDKGLDAEEILLEVFDD
ncbi:MAG: hypothetical protein ACJ71W_22115 [Terriglobales bacterium]